jgi:uroporphyrinogen decarboxylase
LRATIGPKTALQGNLDPAVLFAPEEHIQETTRGILGQLGGVGHILNLGHGILPGTPVDNARTFIETGQQFSFTEKAAAK